MGGDDRPVPKPRPRKKPPVPTPPPSTARLSSGLQATEDSLTADDAQQNETQQQQQEQQEQQQPVRPARPPPRRKPPVPRQKSEEAAPMDSSSSAMDEREGSGEGSSRLSLQSSTSSLVTPCTPVLSKFSFPVPPNVPRPPSRDKTGDASGNDVTAASAKRRSIEKPPRPAPPRPTSAEVPQVRGKGAAKTPPPRPVSGIMGKTGGLSGKPGRPQRQRGADKSKPFRPAMSMVGEDEEEEEEAEEEEEEGHEGVGTEDSHFDDVQEEAASLGMESCGDEDEGKARFTNALSMICEGADEEESNDEGDGVDDDGEGRCESTVPLLAEDQERALHRMSKPPLPPPPRSTSVSSPSPSPLPSLQAQEESADAEGSDSPQLRKNKRRSHLSSSSSRRFSKQPLRRTDFDLKPADVFTTLFDDFPSKAEIQSGDASLVDLKRTVQALFYHERVGYNFHNDDDVNLWATRKDLQLMVTVIAGADEAHPVAAPVPATATFNEFFTRLMAQGLLPSSTTEESHVFKIGGSDDYFSLNSPLRFVEALPIGAVVKNSCYTTATAAVEVVLHVIAKRDVNKPFLGDSTPSSAGTYIHVTKAAETSRLLHLMRTTAKAGESAITSKQRRDVLQFRQSVRAVTFAAGCYETKKLAKAWKELGDKVHAGTSSNSGDEAHQMADGSSSTIADADHEAIAATIRNVISELERVVHVYKQIAAPKPSPRTLTGAMSPDDLEETFSFTVHSIHRLPLAWMKNYILFRVQLGLFYGDSLLMPFLPAQTGVRPYGNMHNTIFWKKALPVETSFLFRHLPLETRIVCLLDGATGIKGVTWEPLGAGCITFYDTNARLLTGTQLVPIFPDVTQETVSVSSPLAVVHEATSYIALDLPSFESPVVYHAATSAASQETESQGIDVSDTASANQGRSSVVADKMEVPSGDATNIKEDSAGDESGETMTDAESEGMLRRLSIRISKLPPPTKEMLEVPDSPLSPRAQLAATATGEHLDLPPPPPDAETDEPVNGSTEGMPLTPIATPTPTAPIRSVAMHVALVDLPIPEDGYLGLYRGADVQVLSADGDVWEGALDDDPLIHGHIVPATISSTLKPTEPAHMPTECPDIVQKALASSKTGVDADSNGADALVPALEALPTLWHGRTICSYQPACERALAFEMDEIVRIVVGSDGDDWWYGAARDTHGWVPANFVTVMRVLVPEEAGQVSDACVAKYSYSAKSDYDLFLTRGDRVCVQHREGDWAYGHQASDPDEKGWFPLMHVAADDDAGDQDAAAAVEDDFHYEALFNYEARFEDELALSIGARVNVIQRLGGGWWEGECNGKIGWFPANYVKKKEATQAKQRKQSLSERAESVEQPQSPTKSEKAITVKVKPAKPSKPSKPSKPAKPPPPGQKASATQGSLPAHGQADAGNRASAVSASPKTPRSHLAVSREVVPKEACCVATHRFSARHEDELSFDAGMSIVVLKRPDGGWWFGRVNEMASAPGSSQLAGKAHATGIGKEGWFPSNHVEPITTACHVASPQRSSFKQVAKQVDHVIMQSTLDVLTPADKKLLWMFRKDLQKNPSALPRVIQAMPHRHAASLTTELEALVNDWSPPSPLLALELLQPAFPDRTIRGAAVRLISDINNDEFLDLLPQLVQAVKAELFRTSPLAKVLLERASMCERVGFALFWVLRTECEHAYGNERSQLLLDMLINSLSTGMQKALSLQVQLVTELCRIHAKICSINGNEQRCTTLSVEMKQLATALPDMMHLPLGAGVRIHNLKPERCAFFSSNAVPLRLCCKNADPAGGDVHTIFKSGDDLRQDALVMQLVRFMDSIWLRNGLNLHIVTFHITPTGKRTGFIEMVGNASTLREIHTRHGAVTGSFNDRLLHEWLKQHNPTQEQWAAAHHRFMASCAGYCVATYLLGVCDRHNDNIMITRDGRLFHIDFGRFLNHTQKFGPISRDRVPFVLTSDMAYVINEGDKPSPHFQTFVDLCCRAYNYVRAHGTTLLSMMALMLRSGIPELQTKADLLHVQHALKMEDTEDEAINRFTKMIETTLKNKFTKLNFFIHNLGQIKSSASTKGPVLSFSPLRGSPDTDKRIKSALIVNFQKRHDHDNNKFYMYVVCVVREGSRAGGDGELIYRRFSEFNELNNKLSLHLKETGHYATPAFPSKIYVGRSHTHQVAKKRMGKLNEYLAALFALDSSLLQNDVFYTFFKPMKRDDVDNNANDPTANKTQASDAGCGQIQLTFKYDVTMSQLTIFVNHARSLPLTKKSAGHAQAPESTADGGDSSKSNSNSNTHSSSSSSSAHRLRSVSLSGRHSTNSAPDPYVKVHILPDRMRENKRKTAVKQNTRNPTFNQALVYDGITPSVLAKTVLEVGVWSKDNIHTRNPCLGQVHISLTDTSLDLFKGEPLWFDLKSSSSAQHPHLLHHSVKS